MQSNIARPLPHLRINRIAFVAALLAAISIASVAAVALWRTYVPHPTYAPDFTLTDQDAHPFTLSSERGHPVILFFGYTHCPDACPTTLAHLAQAVRDPSVPRDVRVAFITVDPFRDSAPTLKRYVRIFNPSFIGLTGTLRDLDPVYAAYHTWREAWPAKHGATDYFVAHGVTIFYIGRDGVLSGVGSWNDTVANLVHDMKGFQ
jgi:cytochrome oxidase Cu insertion factor (SCO1/SenC/PrrC family)